MLTTKITLPIVHLWPGDMRMAISEVPVDPTCMKLGQDSLHTYFRVKLPGLLSVRTLYPGAFNMFGSPPRHCVPEGKDWGFITMCVCHSVAGSILLEPAFPSVTELSLFKLVLG
jgi:hypothetical protein